MAKIKAGIYRFNDVLYGLNELQPQDIQFTVDGESYSGVSAPYNSMYDCCELTYFDNDYSMRAYGYDDENFTGRPVWFGSQVIIISDEQEVSAEFYTWFTDNAEVGVGKQISGVWKFNEQITFPEDSIEQSVNFSVKLTYEGTKCVCFLDTMYVDSWDERLTGTSYGFDQEVEIEAGTGIGYHNGSWDWETWGDVVNIFDFGTEPQVVSDAFYDFVTANAIQAAASVQYNGERIANLFGGQTATLKCAGMTMESDVVVDVAEQSGGGGSAECDREHVIKVDELPTENIDEGAVYLCGESYYKYAKELSDVLYAGTSLATAMGADASMFNYYYADTKPTENIAETAEGGFHIYYIADENDLFCYGDFEGTGECAWMSFSAMMGVPFFGAVSDASEATDNGGYALIGQEWMAYACVNGTLKITENGTYDVADKMSVTASIPTTYMVQSVTDLPTDAANGSIAFVLEDE